MVGMERGIVLFRRVNPDEPMEKMHKRVMEGLSKIDAPLGLKDSEIPAIPDFGTGLLAVYFGKNSKTKGVRIVGSYSWRQKNSIDWDSLVYKFKSTYKLINYEEIININLPKVIEIYEPYEVQAYFQYVGAYEEGTTPETRIYGESRNPAYNKLKSMGITPNKLGENLFVLQPVMYFNGEMCKEVLKLSRDEIIRRLEGKVKKVSPILDGVYIIFNDKVEMSYDEFLEMNNTFKPILDLI